MRLIHNTQGQLLYEADVDLPHAAALLREAVSAGAELSHADLVRMVQQWPSSDQSLAGLDLSGVDLTSAHAVGLTFDRCRFVCTVLRDCHATGASFVNCVFSGTIMDAGSFEHCNFSHSEFVENPQTSSMARHHLRPHSDEFLPFDRVLARSANFIMSKFVHCVFSQVNFTSAAFEQANLSWCIVDKCNFEGAVFDQTSFAHSHVYRSDLVSATLCECDSTGAVFRSNDYFEIPVPKTIADSSFAFPRQLKGYFLAELSHWRLMGKEIKLDYKRQLLIKLLVFSSVPLLALLAWKYVETNVVVSMITAAGAISTWALRRYFTMLLQAAVGFLLGKANDAEGLWRAGHKKQAVISLIRSNVLRNTIKARIDKNRNFG